ncbi:hypothetical protein GTO89_00675 [Heliobacterium gestii]|uniref:Uncharacterized protein n=1 Tax=Heliomicrobium gestii TaxID=2699 RepID=A0A845L8K3_HELGE|nr:hypothetical protein [Heliomicrobium gestii]MBM7865281.1 hypothetical protein [Heliomicrobium gestii]MZP41544.1 hypothetical protein [Heliomicrobium gestii]
MLIYLAAAFTLLAISLYTLNYGSTLWRSGHKPAGAFTWILALAVVAFPILVVVTT